MKPLVHAKNSVRKYGGEISDYIEIHNFLDSSKAHVADMRHRAILHSSFGIFIAEQVFGVYFKNSEGRDISVRDVCEDHVIEDMQVIPTVADYLQHLPLLDWLGGKKKTRREFPMAD